MSTIGIIHTAFASAALLTGVVVFRRRKGGRVHRVLGRVYVASMLGMIATAFFIYRLFGGFGVFHALAIVSLVTLMGGFVPALTRRGNWLERHYRGICWSYVGLAAAAVAEVAVRVPWLPRGGAAFGVIVGASTFGVAAIGGYFINTRSAREMLGAVSTSNHTE